MGRRKKKAGGTEPEQQLPTVLETPPAVVARETEPGREPESESTPPATPLLRGREKGGSRSPHVRSRRAPSSAAGNDALTALMKLLGSIVPCWTKRSDEMTFRDHASAVTVAVLLTIAVLGVVYGHVLLLGPYLSTFASAFLVAAALRQTKDNIATVFEGCRDGRDHLVLAIGRAIRSFAAPVVPAGLVTKHSVAGCVVALLAALAVNSLTALVAGTALVAVYAALHTAEPYLWSALCWVMDGGSQAAPASDPGAVTGLDDRNRGPGSSKKLSKLHHHTSSGRRGGGKRRVSPATAAAAASGAPASPFLNNLASLTLIAGLLLLVAVSVFSFVLLMWVEVSTTSTSAVEWGESVLALADPQLEVVRDRTRDLFAHLERRVNGTAWSPLFWRAAGQLRRHATDRGTAGVTPAALYADAAAVFGIVVNALHEAGVELRSVVENPHTLVAHAYAVATRGLGYVLMVVQFAAGFLSVLADYLFRTVLFLSLLHYLLTHSSPPIETLLENVPVYYRRRLAAGLGRAIEETFVSPVRNAVVHGIAGLVLCALVGAPLQFLAAIVASVLAVFPVISPTAGLSPWSIALAARGHYTRAVLLLILTYFVSTRVESLRLSASETAKRSTVWLLGLVAFGPYGVILAPLLLRTVNVIIVEIGDIRDSNAAGST